MGSGFELIVGLFSTDFRQFEQYLNVSGLDVSYSLISSSSDN
jgi:hypothetical protein